MDFIVFGIAGALVVKRVVDWMKKRGLAKKHAPMAAFAVALVLLGANEAAELMPEFLVWYERVWNVLFYALLASEVYDAQDALLNGARRA